MNHIGTLDITTDRLTLRRFDMEDAEYMFYNWANDPEVGKYLTVNAEENVEEAEDLIKDYTAKYNDKEYYNWAVELNDLEQPVGYVKVVSIDEDTESVELEFAMGQKFWNKGYTKEALTEVVRYFINQVGAQRVWASSDSENIYASKAMIAGGMEYEGTLRKSAKNNNGVADMSYFTKLRSAALDEEDSAEEVEEQSAVATKIVDENGVEHNFISDETMEYVGILAKLELSPEEAEAAKKDMADMLDYIDKLDELDVTGIEPMSHVFPVNNVFRKDEVTNGDGSEATLKNAPVMKNGGFKVPKTIGE